MKRLIPFILILILMLTSLTACNLFDKDKGVTCDKYENCAVFTFADFPEKETASFTLSRTCLGEGVIYYQVNLEKGALSINYKDAGLIHKEQRLGEFTADEEMPLGGSGGYIEGDEITITFASDSPVSGEIIIAFTEDALKAVHKDIQLHEHTREMRSNEYAHWYVYTCGCETPENSAKHSDIDENYICDGCDYVMPGHEHSYEYYHDDIGHGFSYTCGCKTPPNFAQHFDGDGNGRCDEISCEYHMVSYSISYDGRLTSEILMDGYAPTEAKPGNTVQLRAYPIMDADLVLYANGIKLIQTYADSDYWKYIFIMPNEDVMITYDIVGGFLTDRNYEILIETYYKQNSDADYVCVESYYGEFADGAIVAMMASGGYDSAIWEETVGDTTIRYCDGNRILVLCEGEFYTLTAAYENGCLSLNDLQVISELQKEFYPYLYE